MQIREASVEDAVEACQVVRRSIAELCHADHQDDPIVLEKWLSNNISNNMRSWIADPDTYVIVATEGAAIIGVGAIASSGEITLNYVSPDTRFRGFSKAILNRLEARAIQLGNDTCTLTSTETARRFYLSAGYVQFGPPEPGLGKGSSYRMVKKLFHPVQGGKPKSIAEYVLIAWPSTGALALIWTIAWFAVFFGCMFIGLAFELKKFKRTQ